MADEKIIQIAMQGNDSIVALTNRGRMFASTFPAEASNQKWRECVLPDLKKSKPRQSKSEGYSEDFEHLWSMYGRKGNKAKSGRQYEARTKENYNAFFDIESGIKTYLKLIDATGLFKKDFQTFIGPDRHYLDDFTIPEQVKKQNKPEWAKLPFDDEQLESHARKHGLQMPAKMDSYKQYRSKLQSEIESRLKGDV